MTNRKKLDRWLMVSDIAELLWWSLARVFR
ncbi:hypothetical protein [Bacteriophage Titan-X]|uniref:Uncharacterized protein n=1 Tax=Bacteriophage Titan-X TaxID=2662140 RepID=A0A5Q2UAH0_9CAUD|nr:hypothetical protein [Bacteriophage Titan-X]